MRRLLVLPPVLVVLLCGFLAVSEEPGRGVLVDDIRMGVNGEGQTRLVLDLQSRPDYIVGPVGEAQPEIVVHLEGGRFLPGDGVGEKPGKGVIREVSWGPSLLRISLKETALPTRHFILPPSGKIKHHRLVVDLDPAAPTLFAAEAEAFRTPLDGDAVVAREEPLPVLPEPIVTARKVVPTPSLKPDRLPDIEDLASLPPVSAGPPRPVKNRPLIVIDPGHGGHEPGAIGQSGTMEDTVTLAYAKALQATLTARGYDVMLTRSDDTYVKHEDRIGLARVEHADLFMSLHADSHEDHSLRGGSVYTLSPKRSDKLENEIRNSGNFVLYDVEVRSEDGVGDILLDLAQNVTRANSDRLANSLISNMRPVMPLVKNPKRRGALLVLLSPDVPAVLVELAFLSNSQDEANLTSPSWRRSAVGAIADGVDAYFDESGVEARLAGGSGAG